MTVKFSLLVCVRVCGPVGVLSRDLLPSGRKGVKDADRALPGDPNIIPPAAGFRSPFAPALATWPFGSAPQPPAPPLPAPARRAQLPGSGGRGVRRRGARGLTGATSVLVGG